jgi:hypothetical protein
MKLRCRSPSWLAFAALSGWLIGCATPGAMAPSSRLSAAQAAIGSWPESSRLSAAVLIDEYGPPDRVEAYRLVWNNAGLCRRLPAWPAWSSAGDEDIECTVAYPVPVEQREALAEFSSRLQVSVDGTELSARSDSEDVNRLTLNLAALIIAGLDPSEARRSYDNALRLRAAGKTSALTANVLFGPTPEPKSPWPFRLDLSPGTLTRNPLWSNEPASYPGYWP